MAVQYAFSQITTQGLKLAVDAADPLSYPGSGTTWTDVTGNGFTGTVSSSISFVTTNRGALYSANSSSAVTFAGTAADFGSDSFTVEMAFTPLEINGQHFLYSKNSGSFPNFGAFLTGSGGSGRLVAFYNVSSTVSCSASTPTGSFITGSNYIVDVTCIPSSLATYIYTNSNLVTQSVANGTGSLSTSASLFLLNNSISSNAGSVANLYSFKVYNPYIGSPFVRKNYNTQAARFGLPLATYIPPAPLLLDTYSGAAAAYSLRLLKTSYSGAAIRVRRSSDNTEADIGFTVNGDLDTGALLSFCGAGNGFVTTWYDQSGNGRNATQTTAAYQPQIVSSGGVLTLTGTGSANPCIRFDGSNDFFSLSITIPISTGDKFSVFQVEKKTASNSIGLYIAGIGNGGPLGPLYYSNGNVYTTTKINATTDDFNYVAFSGNNYNLLSAYSLDSTTNSKFYVNNSILNLSSSGSQSRTASFSRIGNRGTEPSDTSAQELILYMSDQSSNRTGIESNINSFYSIY